MTFAQLTAKLATISGVNAVFADGQLYDMMDNGRHMDNTPYIEVVDSTVDVSEESSTNRWRKATADGRIVCKRFIDDPMALGAAVETTFKNDDGYQVTIGQPEVLNWKCLAIPITIEYFGSYSRT